MSRPRPGMHHPVAREQSQPLAVPMFGFDRVGSVDVGRGPVSRIVESGRGRLLVTNPGYDGLAVLDPARLAIVAVAGDVYEPFAGAAANGRAYVSSVTVSSDELAEVEPDSGRLLSVHPLMGSVRDLVASRDGSRVYITRTDDAGADVAVFETATAALASIPVGGPGAIADAVAVSPDGSRLYVGVALNFASNLVVVDTATAQIVNTVTIDAPIRGVAVHPSGRQVYILGSDPAAGGTVHVVDARTGGIISAAPTGGLPTALTISRDGGRLYVADIEQVTVLCTATAQVVDAITAGAEPSCVVESADGAHLYVADYEGSITVFAISAATVPHVATAPPTIRRQPQVAGV